MIRKLWIVWMLVMVVSVMLAQGSAAEVEHRIGIGAHYWTVLSDIDADDVDVDEDGLAYLLTYQLRPASLIKFGIDIEMLPENFGGSEEEVFAPQAYVIIGGGIYAGIGIGGYYTDGEFSEDTFYNVRAGFDFCLFPFIYVDVNANYRFEDWGGINTLEDDITEDTVTLGAAVRFAL